ncbi:MAG: hypothetical protein Q4F84_09185 [Fibrobacter sp.]|nr:hypothetical protein [Fibrobacter sp.]
MFKNTLCIIAATIFSASAQAVNLQGVVSGSEGTPISGAFVSLVNQNMKDTTNDKGEFSFIVTSVKKTAGNAVKTNNISLKNNTLQFSLNTQSTIKVAFFDLKGNLLRQETQKNAGAGTHQIDISKSCKASNVYLIKASAGNSEASFRYVAFNGNQQVLSSSPITAAVSGNRTLAANDAVDTLKVEASGFISKTVPISSLDNQNQNVTLEKELAGKEWQTANPDKAGPFEVATDKNVGPLAGSLPDQVYGDKQQRFNVYRPKDLAKSEYLHPILIWANGFGDNPEQNPPDCITNSGQNKWCGQYSPIIKHLASHGFVVVASLSSVTGRTDANGKYPTTIGLDWIIEQNDDPQSPYYHKLDTSKIGQLGHSFGGMSTCLTASDPRFKALATICGTSELKGVHTPMLFYCGGRDNTVSCDGVKNTYKSVTDQPAFFMNEKTADHGSWVYTGASGVSLTAAAAWFRTYLMNDTECRKYFYGQNCRFSTDSRVEIEQNSLMKE